MINIETIISIILNKKEDFYNKYSKNKINNELEEYIFNECYGEIFKNNIRINIYISYKIDDNEKNEMIDTIRRTFGLKVQDELYYYNKARYKKTILFLLGIVFIVLYYLLFSNIIREIILILGWLAIWESVYSFLTDSNRDYIYIYRLKQLSKAKIYFSQLHDSNS